MGEGLGARPQLLLNAGPVLRFLVRGAGRGMPLYFFTRTRVVAGFHFRNISIRCEQSCSKLAAGNGRRLRD